MAGKTEIARLEDVKPASFTVTKEQEYPQVKVVIDLLVSATKEQRAITKEDIVRVYANFKCRKTGTYSRWEWKNGVWANHPNTPEELIKDWRIQYHSITWFKNVLGMAIIRGKLLVIPIIDLDEPKQLANDIP